MNAAQLYDALVAQGIAVTTDGEHLDVEGPDTALTDATIEGIREQKRALIAHLRLFVEADEVTGEFEGVLLTVEECIAIRTLRRWLQTGAIAALPPDTEKYGYYRDRAECERRAGWYLADAVRTDAAGANGRRWVRDVVAALLPLCDGDTSDPSSEFAGPRGTR